MGVSRKFQGSFKNFSRKFRSLMFRGCFKGVLRVFQGSFKKTFKVFQKSIMLHGTHRSFPSRRRACFFLLFDYWAFDTESVKINLTLLQFLFRFQMVQISKYIFLNLFLLCFSKSAIVLNKIFFSFFFC